MNISSRMHSKRREQSTNVRVLVGIGLAQVGRHRIDDDQPTVRGLLNRGLQRRYVFFEVERASRALPGCGLRKLDGLNRRDSSPVRAARR